MSDLNLSTNANVIPVLQHINIASDSLIVEKSCQLLLILHDDGKEIWPQGR